MQGSLPRLPPPSHPSGEKKGRERERLQPPQNKVTSPESVLAQTCSERTSHALPLLPHRASGRPLSPPHTPRNLFSAWGAFFLGSPTTTSPFGTFFFLLLEADVAPGREQGTRPSSYKHNGPFSSRCPCGITSLHFPLLFGTSGHLVLFCK